MSNSYRKTPITGITTCASEKKDKQAINRRMRKKTKSMLTDIDNETNLPMDKNEFMSTWNMGKDGKAYRSDLPEYLMRK